MHAFSSPFWWLPASAQRITCLVVIIVMLGLAAYLSHAQQILKEALPNGVVELEAPWTTNRATTLIASLKAAHLIEEVRRQTYWDSVFLLVYPFALSLSCAILASAIGGKTALVGTCVSWGVLLACPADALENLSILKMLNDETAVPWPHLATICACVKFTLASGGLFFVVSGLVIKGLECVRLTH
ncbi:hypothetical protein B0G73_1155 [Paraburkholderia sp. BL25I1N1]|nr:hypothetical protein B0G73_1155 [Paraburkholderia sp. BL25I1N1]